MDQRSFMYPYQMHHHHMHQLCQQHLHKQVKLDLVDGQSYEGYIENVDDQNVYLIVEIDVNRAQEEQENEEENEERGFGYNYGYGYPGYGYGYGYGPGFGYPGYYGYPGYGFGRLVLPLAALTALSLL